MAEEGGDVVKAAEPPKERKSSERRKSERKEEKKKSEKGERRKSSSEKSGERRKSSSSEKSPPRRKSSTSEKQGGPDSPTKKSGSRRASRFSSSTAGKAFAQVYEVGEELGKGAFAVVKEATHKTKNKSYAVKIVDIAELSEDDELTLQDEIAVLRELKHPNIIYLTDVFHEKLFYYLVTEKMEGGELFDRIVQKTFYNEKEARDTCLILFEAMKYIHKHKIAHRDLKPNNLLLATKDNDSLVKVADFGFAKKCPDNDLTTMCGTPRYVAPEILRGKPYGTSCDMWSMGVIVYILLGGYPPFTSQDQKELFKTIKNGEWEFHEAFWGEVSDDAKHLISSLLTLKPRKRMTASEALKSNWITKDSEKLAKQDLAKNLAEFKKFNAKRKFMGAVKMVMATNKLNSLGIDVAKLKQEAETEADPTEEESSGTFEDNYDKGKELGKGAFAVVHVATHKKTARQYAVKIVDRTQLDDKDEEGLQDEIAVLKLLDHPNIIYLSDVYSTDNDYFLVTELMGGGELFDRIVQKQFYNEKEARDTCVVLLEAMKYIHKKKIAHRDLKPNNLLLASEDSDSECKIADFGFAKKADSSECLSTMCGTPRYVAPEILRGKKYGTQCDMWSIGVIIFILLGGYPPFANSNQKELFRSIKKGDYEFHEAFWGEVSAEAKHLIKRLLTLKPSKRYTASDALKSKWIKEVDEKALEEKDLNKNLAEFKKFNAKRKFMGAVKMVVAANKFNSLGVDFEKNLDNEDEDDETEVGADEDEEDGDPTEHG